MRYGEGVLGVIVGCLYLLYSIFISIRFSPKLGCVEKFVKYREIPLS